MKSRLISLLAALVLAIGATVTVPTPAQAAANDASITNLSGRTITVCRSLTACSQTGRLYNQQNSRDKFGWSDTDAYWLPAGWKGSKYATCNTKGRWVKVPGLFGRRVPVTIAPCSAW